MIKERETVKYGRQARLITGKDELYLSYVYKKRYNIYFPKRIKELVNERNLALAYLRKDSLTDEIDIVISNEEGAKMVYSMNARLTLCSKEIVNKIYETLGLEKKSRVVRISDNLSKRENYLVYRIINEEGKR